MLRSFAAFVVLLFAFGSTPLQAQDQTVPDSAGRAVTPADVNAVIQAIQDEIYANSLQGDDSDAGLPDGMNAYRLKLYVQPKFNPQGLAWAIYKLLPYGEVVRMFWIRPDGMAVLDGSLKNEFPPTEPSYLTVYMDDGQLWHEKQTWLQATVPIEFGPGPERLRAAAARQKQRFAGVKMRKSGTISQAEKASPAYKDSLRAAQESSEGPDPGRDAKHFVLDYGQPLPMWAAGVPPVRTFGPFLKTLGSPQTGKDVKVLIKIFP